MASRRNAPSGGIDAPLTAGDVEALFETILRRPLTDTTYRDQLVASGMTLRELIVQLRGSDELKTRMRDQLRTEDRPALTDPLTYRCPRDLAVTPTHPGRVILIGSCLMEMWTDRLGPDRTGCTLELYLLGNDLPDEPQLAPSDYDFQVVQMPLRSLLTDAVFPRLAQSDLAGHEALFAHGLKIMRFLLERSLRWNRRHGLLSFVLPVPAPQQNSVGRLMPRYDLRNPVHFIEKLNEALAREIQHIPNVWFVDLNEIIATHGRRFVHEDAVAQSNHGGFLSNFDYEQDRDRLEAPLRVTELHEERIQLVVEAAWQELVAMWRTVRGADAVKLVVIDLDDTLWRGCIADTPVEALPTTEGWPLALWEALLFLKRRGILLAIISRNDDARVVQAWPAILGHYLSLDDFAARRINWQPKSQNMAEILAEVNLLPCSVVFIDDNPSQRAEVAAAFPDIRVLGGNPLTWRRILLWSAETQLASITAESGVRTEMVRAQGEREQQRRAVDPADFRAALDVRMDFFAVDSTTHPRFARVLELINKTNQFNTTGQRWTIEQCIAALAAGTRFHAFDLADRYTQYGLVGVLITDRLGIRQFVMSCRVLGLDAEIAAISAMIGIFAARGRKTLLGTIVETDRNLPCRDVYARCGFRPIIGAWQRAVTPPLPVPAHISVTLAEPADASQR